MKTFVFEELAEGEDTGLYGNREYRYELEGEKVTLTVEDSWVVSEGPDSYFFQPVPTNKEEVLNKLRCEREELLQELENRDKLLALLEPLEVTVVDNTTPAEDNDE